MTKRKDQDSPADQEPINPPQPFNYILPPFEALIRAINECQNVSASRFNPHFKSKYFGLSDLLDIVKPTFAKYGLVIIQMPNTSEERLTITAHIYHHTGHIWDMGTVGIKAESLNLQHLGSAMSYLRRYQLSTICGVAADMDDQEDDGNSVARAQGQQSYSPKAKAQAKPQADLTAELGLNTPEKVSAASFILKRKGWLADGQALTALDPKHIQSLMTPQMRQSFLKAVEDHINSPEL